jgi:hypothetical protein
MLPDILNMSAEEIDRIIPQLSEAEQRALWRMIEDEELSPYLKYNGDLKRIITEEWGEGLWSLQDKVLTSFRDNRMTCVVTTPGVGKSDIVSMIICAAVAAAQHDPTQIRIITTAANFRLVKTIMWPYIKRVAREHKLPGGDSKFKASRIGSVEWYINDVLIADGMASGDQDETAMRGIHSLGRVIVIVDEASGISKTIGRVLNGLITAPDDRLVVLGNPPTDETDTWFEWFSELDNVNTIHVPYTDTPNFTGEITPICVRCGPRVPEHTISKHLTSRTSIEEVRAMYPDENDPYVRAFLYAEFPTGNTAKAIPMSFIQKALPVPTYEVDGVKVVDEEWIKRSKRTGAIRLGIDVAADGGDEVVVAKRDGWHGTIVHHSSGPENENAVQVAGKIMPFIIEAAQQHTKRGITEPVMVNVDRNGVGWGVTGFLQTWVTEQHLNVVVVGVMVQDKARNNTRFRNQRAEIWWNMREVLQNDEVEVTLGVDKLVLKQLNGPTYKTGTDGRIQIETKQEMRNRGVKSPDRGDALMLAYYDSPSKRRNLVPTIFPELGKANESSFDTVL